MRILKDKSRISGDNSHRYFVQYHSFQISGWFPARKSDGWMSYEMKKPILMLNSSTDNTQKMLSIFYHRHKSVACVLSKQYDYCLWLRHSMNVSQVFDLNHLVYLLKVKSIAMVKFFFKRNHFIPTNIDLDMERKSNVHNSLRKRQDIFGTSYVEFTSCFPKA